MPKSQLILPLISLLFLTLVTGPASALTGPEYASRMQALQQKAMACGASQMCMEQVMREMELLQMEWHSQPGTTMPPSPPEDPCYGVRTLWAEDAARTGQPPYNYASCYNVTMNLFWEWDEGWQNSSFGQHRNFHISLKEQYNGRVIVYLDKATLTTVTQFQIDGPVPRERMDAGGVSSPNYWASLEPGTQASGLPCCTGGFPGHCSMASAGLNDFIVELDQDNAPSLYFDYNELRNWNQLYTSSVSSIQPRFLYEGRQLCNEGAGYGPAFDHPFVAETLDDQIHTFTASEVQSFLSSGSLDKNFPVDISMTYFDGETYWVQGEVEVVITRMQ